MKKPEKNIVFKGLLAFLMMISTTVWANSFDDFFSAVKRDDVSAVRQLAQRGFDLNTRNEAGEHALFLSLRDDAPAVSSFLLGQDKVQVEARTGQDESPLMMAALKGRLEAARRLIARKAEVNKPGWAPLHYAATNPDAEALPMVRLLLEHHAYIDAESPNGTTPLMMAAHYGHPSVVKLLLEEGADPMLKNQQGLSAIDFANRAQRAESAEIIAASVRARQPRGRW
ncbi:ankyrin repeat domain-containing protein [Hydrogenophaga sp.]|jgi:ankyrin repeat protein|uniref:ankyrin repeat domain-containing protein n=1 Tax=Hydrogenophaga sp. TaxID=1904254 RepID=UPI0025BFBC83|nr:ankyrin repeat domain-containing protein [Hydrogenophaga sp.]MDP1687310.1 ankyrin repeat domain-containing protein [Hydrogenophaga sp.]